MKRRSKKDWNRKNARGRLWVLNPTTPTPCFPAQLLFTMQSSCLSFLNDSGYENYRKIPKISPGAYIFQRPFLKGLIRRGLSNDGNLRFTIDRASLTVGSKFICFDFISSFYPFYLDWLNRKSSFLSSGNAQKQKGTFGFIIAIY